MGQAHATINEQRKQIVMDFFVIPRRIARLEYLTARLPFTILDKYIAARYWDDQALPRLSLRLFLGSMDELAGILLADDRISRRGQALMRGTEFPAEASELEAEQEARWAQAGQNLRAAQTAARQAGEQAYEGIKVAAAGQHEQEDDQQAHRKAEADKRRLVKYHPGEAGRPAELATSEHDTT